MAWAEFQQCCEERGARDIDVLEQAGKDLITGTLEAWRSLPQDLKSAIISTVSALGSYATAALEAIAAAAGVAAGEALAWLAVALAAGVGIGVGADILYECLGQW